MADLGKTLARLAGEFFAHQARKHLGDRFLVTLGQELVGYAGETTSEKLSSFFAQGKKSEQLIAAFKDADSCFADKCADPELRQCILALPLHEIPTLEKLASRLPQTLDEQGLLAAIHAQFHTDWPNLSQAQLDAAAAEYLGCLSHALAAKFDQLDIWSYLEVQAIHKELRELRGLLIGFSVPGAAVNGDVGLDVQAYAKWITSTYQKMKSDVFLELAENVVYPEILTLVLGADSLIERSATSSTVSSDPTSLIEIASRHTHLVLLGESGTGKTVALWQLASHYCHSIALEKADDLAQGRIPIVVDCVGNSRGQLVEVIQRSLRAAGQELPLESINELARIGRWALLLDDFDLIKADLQSDFMLQLRAWSEAYSRSQIVVVSHRPKDGHNLGMKTFRIQPLGQSRARQILLSLPNIWSEGALAIMHGLPEDSRHLVTSPLTLRMLAYAYLHSGRIVPRSRGTLYQEVINGILALGEKKGQIYFDRSEKRLLLARMARWMLDHETYAVSPAKLSSLITMWVDDPNSSDLRHLESANQLLLRAEVVQSGLLRVRLDGEIEFIHNTFLAYFAALTIEVTELNPLLEKTIWHTSIVLWVSLFDRYQTDKLVDLLDSRPVLLGKIVSERAEARRVQPAPPDDIREYFNRYHSALASLVGLFNCLMVRMPGQSGDSKQLGLVVAQTQSNDFMTGWHVLEQGKTATMWVSAKELLQQIASENAVMQFAVTLINAALIDRYHPVELAYLWTTRALYDWLRTGTLSGGINVAELAGDSTINPAGGLAINRFLLLHALASSLPAELSSQLDFYAYKKFKLAVEVDLTAKPPRIRYGIAEAHAPAEMAATTSTIKGAVDDMPLFRQDEKGNWWFKLGRTEYQAEAVGDIDFADVLNQAPDNWARSQIFAELEQRLPGFPPVVL
jgi:hypothetical protein